MFHHIFCFGKKPFRIIDADVFSRLRRQFLKKSIVAMIDDSDFMKIPDYVRSDEDSRGKFFGQLYPFGTWYRILTDDLIENDPGIIDMESRILEEQPFYHFFIERSVYPPGDSAVTKYDLCPWEFPQDFF